MGLKAIVADQAELDALPEGVRGFYVKQPDESFLLSVDGVGGVRLEDVDGLKKSLAAERAQHKAVAAEHKALTEKYGDLDPAAAREALERIEKIGAGDGDEAIREQVDAKVAEIRAKYERDTEKARQEFQSKEQKLADAAADYQARLYAQMLATETASAIAAVGGNPKLLGAHVRSQLVVNDHEGVASVQVRGPDGNILLTAKPNSTEPMSVAEYVASLREDKDFAPAFAGASASGTGAGRTGRGSVPGVPQEIDMSDPRATAGRLEEIASGALVGRRPGT